jgi:hypothetical protein
MADTRISRNFRVSSDYSSVDVSRFDMALRELIASPPADNGELATIGEKLRQNVVQKKVGLSADDWQLFDALKQVFHLKHDYELVNLVMARVGGNSFYCVS